MDVVKGSRERSRDGDRLPRSSCRLLVSLPLPAHTRAHAAPRPSPALHVRSKPPSSGPATATCSSSASSQPSTPGWKTFVQSSVRAGEHRRWLRFGALGAGTRLPKRLHQGVVYPPRSVLPIMAPLPTILMGQTCNGTNDDSADSGSDTNNRGALVQRRAHADTGS